MQKGSRKYERIGYYRDAQWIEYDEEGISEEEKMQREKHGYGSADLHQVNN